jgi:hypothetical protein
MFISSLFTGAVSNSDYIALNNWMISKELELMRKEAVMA